ncbi:PepSY domain-containing protein [Phaeobacter sp. C3_T13_0]|uniref:PepSY domain-containing protein n=1 Tax=Phaeobacter cretensis TaxID=3342641 RepID=UPI0039BD148D
MITKTTASIVMTATLIAFGFAAQTTRAETTSEPELSYEQMLNAPVSLERAMAIAKEQAKGRLVEIVLSDFNNQPVFEAVIAEPTSLTEVVISATDGGVLSTARQTAATPEILQQLLEEDDFGEVMECVAMMDVMFEDDILIEGECDGHSDKG